MEKKQKILLSEKFTKYLMSVPETGMGYHRVDVYLKNGAVIKSQIVLNCSILSIDNTIIVSTEDIEKIVVT